MKHQKWCTLDISDSRTGQIETERQGTGAENQLWNMRDRGYPRNRATRGEHEIQQNATTRLTPALIRDQRTSRMTLSTEIRHTGNARVYRSLKSRQPVSPSKNNSRATKTFSLVKCSWCTRKVVASRRRVTAIRTRWTRAWPTAPLPFLTHGLIFRRATIVRLYGTGVFLPIHGKHHICYCIRLSVVHEKTVE